MDVWWLIAALIFGLVMGYFCPFRPRPKIKTVGELYVSPPDEDHKDPYLYFKITNPTSIFESKDKIVTIRVFRR